MKEMNCKICGNKVDNKIILIKEMFFKLTTEAIPYIVCNKCGTVQIQEIPCNIDSFYPISQYYSFVINKKYIKDLIKNYLIKKTFIGRGVIFKILDFYELTFPAIKSIRKLNLPFNARILDVGCGYGFITRSLKNIGFKNISGIDPFIDKDINDSIEIRKIDVHNLEDGEIYDLIMFHHSFEHISDPVETLLKAKKHLSENGIILIRMPIIGYAFEKYRENWYQLDAPRHLFIYSIYGIEELLRRVELKIADKYYDSNSAQFKISGNYLRNISLVEQSKRYYMNFIKSIFSMSFYKFRREAKILNKNGNGDSIVLYIMK